MFRKWFRLGRICFRPLSRWRLAGIFPGGVFGGFRFDRFRRLTGRLVGKVEPRPKQRATSHYRGDETTTSANHATSAIRSKTREERESPYCIIAQRQEPAGE